MRNSVWHFSASSRRPRRVCPRTRINYTQLETASVISGKKGRPRTAKLERSVSRWRDIRETRSARGNAADKRTEQAVRPKPRFGACTFLTRSKGQADAPARRSNPATMGPPFFLSLPFSPRPRASPSVPMKRLINVSPGNVFPGESTRCARGI